LSINGAGDPKYTASIYNTSLTHQSRGLYVGRFPASIASPGSQMRAITGTMRSGNGWTFGLEGASNSPTPSSAGRAFGVFGTASNATSNFNYGVFGLLGGSNEGAGVLGIDAINFIYDGGGDWSGSTAEIPSFFSSIKK